MVKPRENRVPIMMSAEELSAIDDWRFRNRIATRSDAIRRLCQNGLAVHEEVGDALDEASDIWDDVVRQHHKLWTIMMQVRGRHEDADPPQPPRHWSAEEIVDRDLEWTSDLIDRCHVLYLDLMRLNNRVMTMSNAPHFSGGKRLARREEEEIDGMRQEVLRRREEGDENRRIGVIATWLDRSGQRERYEGLTEDEKERFWGNILEKAKKVSKAAITFSDEEVASVVRRNDEPYDLFGVADFIAIQVLVEPDFPPDRYERMATEVWPNADTTMIKLMVQKAIAARKDDMPRIW